MLNNLVFIIENWQVLICAAIALTAGGVAVACKFFIQPSGEQLAKIEEWLLWAVSEAERQLGSGTGKLKLSLVYDSFLKAFPWMSRIVTVELFSILVDKTLAKMRDLLEKNPKAAAIVKFEVI
jgi:hypothetical protein